MLLELLHIMKLQVGAALDSSHMYGYVWLTFFAHHTVCALPLTAARCPYLMSIHNSVNSVMSFLTSCIGRIVAFLDKAALQILVTWGNIYACWFSSKGCKLLGQSILRHHDQLSAVRDLAITGHFLVGIHVCYWD